MNSFRVLMFVLPVVLLSSCFKDKKTLNNLKGEWNIENWYEAGVLRNISGRMEFNDCKLRKDDCDGWLTYNENWPIEEFLAARFEYSFDTNDKTMELKVFENEATLSYDADFELDEEELILEYFDEENNFIRIELRKNE